MIFLLHMEGLPWMNGYDSCLNYGNSRVIEMIDFNGPNNGYNFISNCNAVNFWKPSTESITLSFYYTRINDETRTTTADDVSYIFSITGLDRYKIMHPMKDIIIPRIQTIPTVNFKLSTRDATSIDSRNRAFIFSNINLRDIIGAAYDKYKKFALITKFYASNEITSNFTNTFSGNAMGNIMISGFDWYRPSNAQYNNFGTVAQQQEMAIIHPTPSCVCCQVVYVTSGFAPKSQKETYVENVFEKSTDRIDISISNTSIYGYYLVPANGANTELFPHYTFLFDIIPLEN